MENFILCNASFYVTHISIIFVMHGTQIPSKNDNHPEIKPSFPNDKLKSNIFIICKSLAIDPSFWNIE